MGNENCKPCTSEASEADAKPIEEVAEDPHPKNDFLLSTCVVPVDRATYAWLRWGPNPNSPCGKALMEYFPSALPGNAICKRVEHVLRERCDMVPSNTLYGQSICPDEINNEKGDMAYEMAEYWGGCFPMGGIGGAPFVGKTGYMAFSSHVPKDGNVLILFGPHIAISESGELGKYLRDGQSAHSTACGAVLGAYEAVKAGKVGPTDPCDMQQCCIKEHVAKCLDKIKASEIPTKTLIHEAYEHVKCRMMEIINTKFGKGRLVLVGGIQLNMPKPFEDHFEPLMFEVHQEGQPSLDLLHEFNFDTKDTASVQCATSPRQSGQIGRTLSRRLSNLAKAQCEEVFSWLCWCPPPESACFKALMTEFPMALPGQVALARVAHALSDYGVKPSNTIYGQSICPDEINNEKGDLAQRMADFWGNCFPMGGIGGAPFVGKTGFAAFSGHVPENGNVVILFGPHIAVSDDGEIGKYLRKGQEHHSTACGAVLAAYNSVRAGKCCAHDSHDMQQSWLREKVAAELDTIEKANNPITQLVHAAYRSIESMLREITNCNFGSGHLVLIGGLQINLPAPYEDHFEPLMFEIRSKQMAPVNLIDELVLPRTAEDLQA